MYLPYDPMISLLGIYPKNPKTLIQRNICTPMFFAALFTITRKWKQPHFSSIDGSIKELQYIYTMEYYLAIKNNEILLFVTAWIDLECPMLSEKVSQRKINTIQFYSYVESKEQNKQTNKQAQQKHTHRYRPQTDSPQRGRELGDWVKKVKGLRSTDQQLPNSHRAVKYSIGIIVNNIRSMYGTRQILEISRGIPFKVYDDLTKKREREKERKK